MFRGVVVVSHMVGKFLTAAFGAVCPVLSLVRIFRHANGCDVAVPVVGDGL